MTVSAELGAATGAAASLLPLVFFDGDRETDLGTVAVDGTLRFRKFQTAISQKIGVQPGQISLSLVRRGGGGRKGGGNKQQALAAADPRKKTPIDEGSDFAAIAREKDCFVLAALRRSSRRSRPHRGSRGGHVVDARSVVVADHHHHHHQGLLPDDPVKVTTAPRAILRRPSSAMGYYQGGGGGGGGGGLVGDILSSAANGVSAAYGYGGLGMWDLNYEAAQAVRNLQQMQRERYLLSVAASGAAAAAAAAAYSNNNRTSSSPYLVDRSVEEFAPELVASGGGVDVGGYYMDGGSEAEQEVIFCAVCDAAAAGLYGSDDLQAAGLREFHCCVNDPVTYDFRSPVGPVRRPTPRKERAASDSE